MVLGLNNNQPDPEAFYQIISKRGHLPRPDLVDTISSRALQHFRLGSPVRAFTLEVCETAKRVRIPLGSPDFQCLAISGLCLKEVSFLCRVW
jgi:hypothetical protein